MSTYHASCIMIYATETRNWVARWGYLCLDQGNAVFWLLSNVEPLRRHFQCVSGARGSESPLSPPVILYSMALDIRLPVGGCSFRDCPSILESTQLAGIKGERAHAGPLLKELQPNCIAPHHTTSQLKPMDFFATLYSIAFTTNAESAPSTPIDADRGSGTGGSGGCIIA